MQAQPPGQRPQPPTTRGTVLQRSSERDPLLDRIYHSESFKYLLIRKIGAGGMGVVYEALVSPKNSDDTFKTCRNKVAVKLLNTLTEEAGSNNRFMQEARAMEKLNKYPDVVKLLDFGNDARQYPNMFLVMDFLDGRSLGQELKAIKRIPWSRTVGILSQVFDILSRAHAEQIVHRDMKPDNVFLLKNTDRVRVLDFGTAKMRSQTGYPSLTKSGNIVGTFEFMPPEAINDTEEKNLANLIARETYSLGALAYNMLAGVPPFIAEELPFLVAQILNAKPMPLSERLAGVPPELDHFLERALSKSPVDRFHSVVEMKSALLGIKWDGKPSYTRTVRGYAPSEPRKHRFLRPLIEVATAAALLFAVGSGIWLSIRYPEKARSAWNNQAVPLLHKLNIPVSKIAVPDTGYIAMITSNPPGAEVFEQLYLNGEVRKTHLGVTPISCGFKGSHNLLIKEGGAFHSVSVSPENHEVSVTFNKSAVKKQDAAPKVHRQKAAPSLDTATQDTTSLPPDVPAPE